MIKNLYYIAAFLLIGLVSCQKPANRYLLDLSGEWQVALDSTDNGLEKNWHNSALDQAIVLPGTLVDAGLGNPNTLTPKLEKPQLLHLTQKNSYVGAAWYTKEITIPNDWENKSYRLNLERVIWKTKIWVDGVEVPIENNSLIAPHSFDLSQYLKPGQKHRLTILVDNRKQFDISVNNLAHAYTDDTQIIWNGIIGKMELEATDPVSIANVGIYPDIKNKKATIQVKIDNKESESRKAKITATVKHKQSNKALTAVVKDIVIAPGNSEVELEYPMGDEFKTWSEFNPELYTCEVSLETENKYKSVRSDDFGMREIKIDGITMLMNDTPVFLRGTLECNIFPLTGHPPMEKEGWYKVFNTAKEWGLNHLRFHSWCPPKAAFEVADELGFYLQVELPAWTLTIGEKQETTDFLYSEAERIISEYGNHPSFCLWSMGNELQGDMSVLAQMVDSLKAKDNRHLYTNTSFTFEKGHGYQPEPNDDFFITQWTDKGWVRGQGVFNSEPPSFDKNFEASLVGMSVPLITHEIGQYAVYPNLKEIDKYKGVLIPLNFMAVKNDLESKGLIDKADNYTKASGKLAALLYKEEIERALKTSGISGFQLLDLHDFPGQGTALVGLLDAFWESKGVIEASDFRQFCAPVVPLIDFAKATYRTDEIFSARINVSNYSGKNMTNQDIEWQIYNGDKLLESGKAKADLKSGYNADVAEFTYRLDGIKDATQLKIKVHLTGTDYFNQWNIWVYPAASTVDYKDVVYTRNISEALSSLEKGKKVLLNPDWKTIKGVEGKFIPVFWSPVHFPKQAGSMGVLTDPSHPALKQFPTDMHTDWQWWDLNINSTTMITDSIRGGNAIVEMVDNFTNNRKLALVYEGAVGNGKLLVSSIDLFENREEKPVAKQMLISLLNYMNSDEFKPAEIQNPEILHSLISKQSQNKKESATSIY